ncbi:MAG: DUF2029 domain-containing protein [Ktedonobacteraceae bacterium]|nr:DUF2029 domain-containing protein [Ktedonobacteraceae bacterium]
MRRFVVLCILLAIGLVINVAMLVSSPMTDKPGPSFLFLWCAGFVPYLAACLWILNSRPAEGRLRWLELAMILVGAVVLRAVLLPMPPNLSHDSWRYVWDARVTLHGYSPYVYAPGDPMFSHLRDIIYENSRFRNVPTLYPPAAQAVYLLSYLIFPSSLFGLKGIFLIFDLVSCALLAYLLHRRRLDAARCIIYAWCPLPIIEFAIQGHVDVITITFTLLTVVVSLSKRKGMDVVTGCLLGIAALTKIYPLVFLVAFLRGKDWYRRDWKLIAACLLTIVAGYVPYLILGSGQVLGFFSTYASEHTPNAGLVQHLMGFVASLFGIPDHVRTIAEYALDFGLVAVTSLALLRLCVKERISSEAAILILTGVIFVVSSHIFPWYTPALLPWAAVLIQPIWTRRAGLNAQGLAAAAAWYFACISITGYADVFAWNWIWYYVLAYGVTIAAIGTAVIRSVSRPGVAL